MWFLRLTRTPMPYGAVSMSVDPTWVSVTAEALGSTASLTSLLQSSSMSPDTPESRIESSD